MKAGFNNLKISVIGLGLIGGSLARAFSRCAGISSIVAVDRNTESLELAKADNVISAGYTTLHQDACSSDIIFICTPVKQAVGYIEELKTRVGHHTVITDACSTKSEILESIAQMEDAPCFVGGHPMAGSEKSGYNAGAAHLFENAYYVLTPSATSTTEALNLMKALVECIGAIPIVLDAVEHDIITGSISHIPHIAASALVNLVRETDSPDGKMQLLAAGGFKDITRIASSSPEMWENIVLSNKKPVCDILQKYIDILSSYKAYIENDSQQEVHEFFAVSKAFRDTFSNTRKGLIAPVFDLIADVEDKPGIIGEIATLLGNNGINIKNINISNSREFEQGCLRITLPDAESLSASYELLRGHGIKVVG